MPAKNNRVRSGRTSLAQSGKSPAADELELLKQKIEETQELFQKLTDRQISRHRESTQTRKEEMSPVSMIIPARQKKVFDVYRAKARLSFKSLMVRATEEYIQNHPL